MPKSVLSQDHKMTYAEVVTGMVNRMQMSRFKYGPLDKKVYFIDCLASLQQRLEKYQETHNTEWLMDAANYCILEAMYPAYPDAHFRATDSNESPGYKDCNGEVRHGELKMDEFL